MKAKKKVVKDLNDLMHRSMTKEGVINLRTFDSFVGKLPDHIKRTRHFGGSKCDVLRGPCACGGWHND